MRRIALFLLTNIAVLFLLSIVCHLFGIDQWAAARGYGGMGNLLAYAAVIGMGGAFISLAMSKWTAKMSTGARVIEQPQNEAERWLLDTVRRHAQNAGIGMPEVAIYDAPEMNAFATGMTRNSSLVAVSTGLLQQMDREQVSAVLGHEIGHVANGDMVTLTLIQGVLNTLVIVAARVVGRLVDSWLSGGRDRDGGGGIGYFVSVMVLQIVFGLFASIIVAAFSRWREFRADAAGAKLAGRGAMISALQRLQVQHGESTLPQTIAAFGISGHLANGLKGLFMSHPPLEERIAALQNASANG
ncbi:Heat shock protein. Metallo peptidase. MEROPS family M48B [Dyella jiangningensis]|uniref:protease HtpX n=1 Tax=Dyella sp. AtDHG13 TaxID=1938897 RepID=UPI00088EB531|nr:protease HtpX [Dyella sp. AtDHG13]PXV58567.1 heat shock protein [Dyella sp. AtDHG13]SDL15192.1 Heat shock protein. Metallo peptidase. MEROPS family M48B [Dyella jiangningensis]